MSELHVFAIAMQEKNVGLEGFTHFTGEDLNHYRL